MPLIIDDLLNEVCRAKPRVLGQSMQPIRKGGRVCWFKDNKASILAVAHLDTVNARGLTWGTRVKLDKELFFSPYLDDRLGAYTILHVLPALGIKTDILFTMDEEIGNSTADLFKIDFKYNWIVSFDRRGEDVVCYDYKDDDLESKLKSAGFTTGFGSYSDICKLQQLGCKAFNVGVGYENEHSIRSYFDVDVYERQIAKFERFYSKHSLVRLPHTEVVKPKWGNYGFGVGGQWSQSYLYEGGQSTEYKKWSQARDAKSKRNHPVMADTDFLDTPTSTHLWCPICQKKLQNDTCEDCGKMVLTSQGWWPIDAVTEADMATAMPF